jgi:predicted nucleic acid-binding protein
MSEQFLDTNIFLRHLLGDDPAQSSRATAYFQVIEQGRSRARVSEIVIFEVVFTLERGYRRSKAEIQSAVLPLLELPSIVLPGKRKFRAVFRLYIEQNISFADAYHVVMMRKLELAEIVSFDRDFDRIPNIKRVEPDSEGALVQANGSPR